MAEKQTSSPDTIFHQRANHFHGLGQSPWLCLEAVAVKGRAES